jgi:hypothetical protein
MRKRIVYVLLFMSALAKANSQEVNFGWSLGDFCWAYNFSEGYHVFDINFLRFNVSLEKINLTISPSVFMATINTGRKNTETLYFSFLPLEIVYDPFKWEYAHVSLYGRGAWEFEYVRGIGNPVKMPGAFGGALGLRLGIIPIQSDPIKYTSHVLTIFSEYTTRNEFKWGIRLDLLEVLFLALLSCT